jgi:hypothetical protein
MFYQPMPSVTTRSQRAASGAPRTVAKDSNATGDRWWSWVNQSYRLKEQPADASVTALKPCASQQRSPCRRRSVYAITSSSRARAANRVLPAERGTPSRQVEGQHGWRGSLAHLNCLSSLLPYMTNRCWHVVDLRRSESTIAFAPPEDVAIGRRQNPRNPPIYRAMSSVLARPGRPWDYRRQRAVAVTASAPQRAAGPIGHTNANTRQVPVAALRCSTAPPPLCSLVWRRSICWRLASRREVKALPKPTW